MRRLFVALGYVSMIGPPHAMRLHAEAQGTGDELDGAPLWLAVVAEFMVRSGIFLVASWILQVIVSNEDFRRFQVFNLLIAVYAAGAVHTLIHIYCFGLKHKKWTYASLLRIYRLGRNMVYSIVPALLAAGLVLLWQDYNQMELFEGDWVGLVFVGTWTVLLVLGLLEAFLFRRMPVGIADAIPKRRKRKRRTAEQAD
jgi:FlaA1/EpsC-like NDP-sugar epimerase